MEQSRLILAIILSVAVLFSYPYLLKKLYPQQEEKAVKEVPVSIKDTYKKVPEAVVGVDKKEAPAGVIPVERELVPMEEELVTVETPLYRATLSSIGGGIKSWVLKGYGTKLDPESPNVDMAPSIDRDYSFGTGLLGEGRKRILNFKPSQRALNLSPAQSSTLSLVWVSPEGLKIEKRYTFSGSTYMVKGEVIIYNETGKPVREKITTNLAAYSLALKGRGAAGYNRGAVKYEMGGIERIDADEEEEIHKGRPQWIGVEDKYFLTVLIPSTDGDIEWSSRPLENDVIRANLFLPVDLSPSASYLFKYKAYIGPKEYKRLKAYNLNLERSIEFGKFGFMASPMLVVLTFFYRFIPNYGLAIILLTVVIKIAFYPLTKHSLKSMRDMQKIQPQMAALKEKYKGDKQKMNTELMELYKRQKINPLGGCLPMVLQIPVFIALYEVLYVAIELRHAPFMLWIKDLSAADTLLRLPEALPMLGGSAFGPLPLLMGATMLIQQKMTPTAMDPAQAKMMMFMPIIFTFMFLSFPTGLVLYWLVNNILQIGQQYYIHKSAR
ncbi:MAG: membrane protein insertase YidC [Thermodesulfobacteriota bacterium]